MSPARRVAAALLAAAAAGASAAADESDEGGRAFRKCYSCHSVQEGETGLQGPNLRGVVGRRAASVPDFEYSPAMREAGRRGVVWTEAALDAFVADPMKAVPGTAMSFTGMKSAAERAALIAYLKRNAP